VKREDFHAWLSDPVTKWVFTGVKNAAEQEKAEWVRQSWDNGKNVSSALLELRTRAFALTELSDNGFEDWQEWNGEHDD